MVADTLRELVDGMNAIADDDVRRSPRPTVRAIVEARDREIDNDFSKDAQITAIHGARNYRGDKLIRVATPHKILDPKAGPLIAVRLNILSRKTLGGLETDLSGRCLRADGDSVPGALRRGRGQRLRRRRDDGLQRPRGHLPRRLPLLRPDRRAGCGGRGAIVPERA